MHGPDVTAVFPLPDEAASGRLGAALAPALRPGLVIFLEGDLGTGKTTLVRAAIRALGYGGPVKSPTYSLVEVYVISSLYLYHFDFYRFESPEEFLDAGLAEYFNQNAVCLWIAPQRLSTLIDGCFFSQTKVGGDLSFWLAKRVVFLFLKIETKKLEIKPFRFVFQRRAKEECSKEKLQRQQKKTPPPHPSKKTPTPARGNSPWPHPRPLQSKFPRPKATPSPPPQRKESLACGH